MSVRLKSLFLVDGSLDRPLLHSQGLPLLRCLSDRGVHCFIQSYESDLSVTQGPLGRELATRGIVWEAINVVQHVSAIQRAQMILSGFVRAWRLCQRENISIIHCRSYRPALVGALLKSTLGLGFIFDMRGFLIDEQVILGRWRGAGLKYQIARQCEKWMIRESDAIIATSPQFRQMILDLPYAQPNMSERVRSIPNCVDMQRFRIDSHKRQEFRRRMGWDGRLVIAFVGEARVWENFSQVIAVFQAIKAICPSALLALFVYGDVDSISPFLRSHEVEANDYFLKSVSPADMPAYLGATDVGILIRVSNPFTQTIASPIKFAEYLACGLPVIVNPGVGDTARIINQYRVGVVIDPAEPMALKIGVEKIAQMVQGEPDLRHRCRVAAALELSLDEAVDRYWEIYQMVINNTASRRRLWAR